MVTSNVMEIIEKKSRKIKRRCKFWYAINRFVTMENKIRYFKLTMQICLVWLYNFVSFCLPPHMSPIVIFNVQLLYLLCNNNITLKLGNFFMETDLVKAIISLFLYCSKVYIILLEQHYDHHANLQVR